MMWEKRKDLIEVQPPVFEKAIKGGLWMLGFRVFSNLFYFVRIVVLARLLTPKDFGLFGITLLAIQMLEMLSQTGFDKALIHKKRDIVAYLDTAWIVQVIRGVVLSLFLFVIAPYLASFFEEPMATLLLRAIALALLLKGLNNIGVIYFIKELKFYKQVAYQISGLIADFFVSIIIAIILRNAWALIFGFLAGYIVRLVMSYAIHDYRPRIRLNWGQARELFGYGKWVFSSNLLSYLVTSLDDLVVGRVINAMALGLYQMAYRLSNFAATEISNVVSQVTFPAYSKIRDEKERLKEAVMRTISMVSIVSIPLSCGMFILAPELVRFVLGEKWMPMVPAFQVMCIMGAVRSVTSNFGPVFLSTGRPDIQTKVSIINLSIMGISIYPLVLNFGIMGAVYSRVFTLMSQFYTWSKIMKILQVKLGSFVKTLAPALVCSFVMVVIIVGCKLLFTVGNIATLLVIIVFGAIVYFGSLLILDAKFNYGIKGEIKSVFKAIQ